MVLSLKAKKALHCSQVCHAWCCRNLVMFYDTKKEDKDIEQFFKLRNIAYDRGIGTIAVPSKCDWVTNHNKCKLYSWRPDSCRHYECEKLKSMTLDS